jgi:glycogen(starch) synthase
VRHLIISREYPPASYAPGGIGTYVANIARLMVERNETVHVIAERWRGASARRQTFHDGRLIVHRIGENELPTQIGVAERHSEDRLSKELASVKSSSFPQQWFSWHAAYLAEQLIEMEEIDVVEGQDWEAPLYHLLLRRSLGMGPRRMPPCIVHLHSASTFIRHFNGGASSTYPLEERMEKACIRAADALICPSHYYADQCSEKFNISRESIKVIRYPVGFTPLVQRSPTVWVKGSVCFVGRLEPRKGIIEWIEAAARVARENPKIHFDFVGADNWRPQYVLKDSLASALRPRFRFHGQKSRHEVLPHLANAMTAVVPSRWENFPNVCIEAMSSGLPIIATRLGGMVELIEDGRTGWLAPEGGVSDMADGLTLALRRCLATEPQQRAAMGLAASQSIRRICDNEASVTAHIEFRAEVARRGATRPSSAAFDAELSQARSGVANDYVPEPWAIAQAKLYPPPDRRPGQYFLTALFHPRRAVRAAIRRVVNARRQMSLRKGAV